MIYYTNRKYKILLSLSSRDWTRLVVFWSGGNIIQSSSQRENSTELTWDREAMILSTELVLVWAKFVSEPADPVSPGPLPHTEEPGVGVGAGQRDVLPQRGEDLPLLRRTLVDLILVVLVEGLAGHSVEC